MTSRILRWRGERSEMSGRGVIPRGLAILAPWISKPVSKILGAHRLSSAELREVDCEILVDGGDLPVLIDTPFVSRFAPVFDYFARRVDKLSKSCYKSNIEKESNSCANRNVACLGNWIGFLA